MSGSVKLQLEPRQETDVIVAETVVTGLTTAELLQPTSLQARTP